ncbi:MAG: ATP synthase F1 subunit gamma [Lachnospiraceae bacterium]|nr:ATP synthase F1 subunit gamma [Lachnospiraceae bacterium]
MASMRDIKRRKGSIASTQQITKAMKLVSTVKLQRAKGKAETTKPYFDCMYDTIATMLSKSDNIDHPYLKSGESSRKAVIVITSNRGLAGGYNNNVVKLITGEEAFEKDDIEIYALGKKGRDSLAGKGYNIADDLSEVMNGPMYSDAKELSEKLLDRFEKGEIGEIYLAYTVFKNTVTHVPTMLKLLPVEVDLDDAAEEGRNIPMNYAPNEEVALAMIIPKYITSLIYGAMMEAVASENGARMQAMDSATSNAEEMIQKLSLDYNRARQGSITQELTEIIAGASAIS